MSLFAICWRPITMRVSGSANQLSVARCIVILLLSVLGLSTQAAFAQTGYIGIFGGGPFYKNAENNIREIQNSGFTEAIVWSVEVSSTGNLNLNGEFPLTSGGVYIGNNSYPDFARDLKRIKAGTPMRVTFS